LKGQHLGTIKARHFIRAHRIELLAALAFICFLDWFFSAPKRSLVQTANPGSSTSISFRSLPSPRDARFFPTYSGQSGKVVYPYSVIPGGVRNVQELRKAIARDPVVSSHYGEFRLSRARVVRMDRERLMHVSYRFGNRVYWTKRVMKIAKGEAVITDGVHTARTRCGNLIAEMIPSPASPLEPTPGELDTPVGMDFQDPYHPEQVALLGPGGSGGEEGPSSGGSTPPAILPIGGPTNPVPYIPLPGPPPVVKVPEPGTAILFLTALPILFFLRKRNREYKPKKGKLEIHQHLPPNDSMKVA
jgi:hypothetical protein